MNRAELKARAKGQIKGSILILFVMYLIASVISAVVELIPFIPFWGTLMSLNTIDPEYALAIPQLTEVFAALAIPLAIALVVGLIVTSAFTFGFSKIFLNLSNGQKPVIGDLFASFRNVKVWLKAVQLYISRAVFVLLWAAIGVAPGLVFVMAGGGGNRDFIIGTIFLIGGVIIGIVKMISYSQAFFVLAENPHISAKKALAESKDIMDGRTLEFIKLDLSFILWGLLVVVTAGIAAIWVAPYIYTTLANYYNSIKVGAVDADRKLTVEEKAMIRAEKKKDKRYA